MFALVLASVVVAHGSDGSAFGGQITDAPVESGIEVRAYPEADFVYVKHTGPYWTLGRAIDKAAAYIRAQGLSVPVVVRYAEELNRRSTRTLHCRVGFITTAPHTPTTPFLLARLPVERAATLVITDRMPDPDDDYERLHRWIDDHGYTPAGPITEVYPSIVGPHGASSATAEVRFTLRGEDEPVGGSAEATAQPTTTAADAPAVTRTVPTILDDVLDAVVAPIAYSTADSDETLPEHDDPGASREPTVSLEDPPYGSLTNSSPATLNVASPPVGHLASPLVGDEISGPVPPTKGDAALLPRADGRVSSNAPVTLDHSSAPAGANTPFADFDAEKPSHALTTESEQFGPPAPSVRELFTAGRYAEAVDTILPADSPPAPPAQRWLLEVTMRISAICRGITRLDSASPEMQRSLAKFLRAFDDRSRSLATDVTMGPSPGVEPVDFARHARQEMLLRELDLAIVRIATGSIPAPTAVDSLLELLNRLADLRPIMTNLPSASPTP